MTPCVPYADMLGFLRDVGMPAAVDDATRANILASGVKLFHTTTTWPMRDWDTTLNMHRQSVTLLQAHPETFAIVSSRQDLARLRDDGKIGIILGIQDPDCIGMEIHRVQRLYAEGIRVIQVAYQRKGVFGCGFLVDADDTGLTEIGHKFVEAVNHAGLILDLSHSAPQTALDCLRLCTGPVMISHTCCRGIYDHPRGTAEAVLAEIAKQQDAVVGVLAMTFFLSAADNGLDPMIRHVRHLADRIGAGRVAIGSDAPVGGFTDLTAAERQFRETTQKLMDPHGELRSRWPTHIPAVSDDPLGFKRIGQALAPYFTDKEIEGIMGKNARRFFARHLPPS
jgi:membrane dipeptidase